MIIHKKEPKDFDLYDWVREFDRLPPKGAVQKLIDQDKKLTKDMFSPYKEQLKKLNISVFTEREPCNRGSNHCKDFLSQIGAKDKDIYFCVEYDKDPVSGAENTEQKRMEIELKREIGIAKAFVVDKKGLGIKSFFQPTSKPSPGSPDILGASSSGVVRDQPSTDTVVSDDAKTDDPGAPSSPVRNPIDPEPHDQSKPPLKDPPVGLRYQSVGGNEDEEGHCLFIAVGLYLGQNQEFLRNIVAANIEDNLEQYRDIIQALSPGKTPEQYVEDLRNGSEWADNIEIAVLMKMLDRPIVVVGPDGMVRNLADLTGSGDPIFVQYNGHTHYDALLLTGEKTAEEVLEDLRQLTNPQNLQPQHPGIPVLPMLPPRPQAPITSPFFPVPAVSGLAHAAVTPPSDDRRRVVHAGTGKPTDTKDSRTKIAQDEARKEVELRRAAEERRAPKRSAPESSSSDSDDSSPGSRPPSPTN